MSEDQDDSQKTEDPTQKRLQDAREKGQIPMSREIGTWATMSAILLVVVALAPGMVRDLSSALAGYLGQAHAIPMDGGNVGALLVDAALLLVKTLALPMLLLAAVGVVATLIQTGGLVATEQMKPTLSKLSPLKGLTRMVSPKGLVEFAKSVVKLFVVGAVIGWVLWPMMTSLEHYAGLDMALVLGETKELTVRMLIAVVVILTVVAVADVVYQRHAFHKQLMMSRQDLKEEFKQQEGDPAVKARLRQLRMEKARRRMMANVPKSDVVITNPTHFAVALKYEPGTMQAPVVVAKGADLLAHRIRELAREHGVPIVENPPLARALHASVEIDEEIPAEHYRAMAEVISYVFKLKNRRLPQ
ncbi:flagellar biosynthesis protein FlhB [Arenibaculum sp.]|jgi:flagellar biosynthetic protein FlhB|uniref:flagellar biosynthesis protein FlhB n=1 Tax=Arenibaculum sp. TaxID=2865862 RepID=UPI002E0F4663|nr:flagellar biosynthesis protein FlhB [Arenibaculum sp.]